MTGGAPVPQLDYDVEIAIAAFIAAMFVLSARLSLRARHIDGASWHVFVGAAIYGVTFGAIIVFVVIPLRFALATGEMPTQYAGPIGIAAFVLVIAMRRGLIGRLPFLGPKARAYRRAILRRAIESSNRELARLAGGRAEEARS